MPSDSDRPVEEHPRDRFQCPPPNVHEQDSFSDVTKRMRVQLHIEDLMHPGTHLFHRCIPEPSRHLRHCLQQVLRCLYETPVEIRRTPKLLVVLEANGEGAAPAFVTNDWPGDTAELHLNLSYFETYHHRHPGPPLHRHKLVRREWMGVIVHELVHVFQYDGFGTAPWGVVEGLADWVRLECGYAPPHWDPKNRADRWDAGYSATAYFLRWLAERLHKNPPSGWKAGSSAARELNARLGRGCVGDGTDLWLDVCGLPSASLWNEYKNTH